MAVRVTLLGRFGLTCPSDGPLTLPPKKAQALVAVLALAGGQPVPRERLTALLWSDRGEAQARGSLRQALSALRRAFDGMEPPPLVIDADHVALDPDAAEVDALRFTTLARSTGTEDLEQAAALYRGDLLEGLQVRDPGFEDWLESERQGLRRLLSDALSRLLSLQEQAGRSGPAIVTAERWLAQDPLNEAAHRALMRLYARTGERNRALGQYRLCRETLERELGVAPESATERLHEEIAAGRAAVEEAPAPAAAAEAGALPLPDRPSIAVLPFQNLSGDPTQDYFADALSDEITTALARFRDLFVISRFSSFVYKGRAVKVQDIGRELGVAYVLEGSVQKSADRVRINVQLVEAASGSHLWSKRYDRRLDDIFALQDEAVGTIVSTLAGRLEVIGRERAVRKSEDDLDTYDLVLRAEQRLYQGAKEDVLQSRDLLEQAIERDPGSARAHAGLALSYLAELYADWSTAPERAGERALALARKAVALDDLDSHAHVVLAEAHLYAGPNFEPAEIELEKALELNPNSYDIFCNKTWLLALTGRAEEGIVCADQAFRLNPFAAYDCRMGQFAAAYSARRYEDAVAALRSISAPDRLVNACLAACHAQLGLDAEARLAMAGFLSEAREEMADYPGEDRERWRRYWARGFPFKDPADLDHLLDGLRKAGLPDEPASPASDLPAKATIAVLPFENLSGDAEQAYFADGITEDILTALSKFHSLAVVARASAFTFKDRWVKAQDVGRELGARYIVEGSVRRIGTRLRVTAQLVDAASGQQLWAERYDRELKDVFAVQDEITRTIAATVGGRVKARTERRAVRARPNEFEAYDMILRAQALHYQITKEGNQEARALLERTIKLDPRNSRAHMLLAAVLDMDFFTNWSENPERSKKLALELARKAVQLDDTDGEARMVLGEILTRRWDYAEAEAQFEKALAFNPNDIGARALYGWLLSVTGRAEQGLEQLENVKALDPFEFFWIPWVRGEILFRLRRYEDAISALNMIETPINNVRGSLATCLAHAGQLDRAREVLAEFLDVAQTEMAAMPRTLEDWEEFWQRDADRDDFQHFFDGLRMAGLGELTASSAASPSETTAKPTIAVLPFDNLSGDPEQAYFADGITEDIITGLSRFRDVAVIARTSSFSFRGQSLAVAEIAEKLGVQYIVEGSVRRAGERVRITAQLIDAESGAHRWGQNYDREMTDIFEVQDEVTRTIVATLAGRLSDAGVDRARRKPTASLTALDYLLQGRDLVFRYSREDIAKARRLLEKAIALDPGYAEAHAWLAECHWADWNSGWTADAEGGLERAAEIAAKALALDDSDPQVHMVAGWNCLFRHQYDEARHHFDKAAVSNPDQPDLAMLKSFLATFTGDHAGALAKIQEAMRLDPFGRYGFPLGLARYGLKQYEEAVAAFKTIRAKLPEVIAWRAACHAQMGQDDDARREAARFVEASSADMRDSSLPIPESWLDFLAARNPYQRAEDMAHFTEGLRKAGLE